MDKGSGFFFLRDKPALALIAVGDLDPAYAQKVARRIDSTFSHTSKILSRLEDLGLIRARPEGRTRYLELTDRGRQVAIAISNLIDLVEAPSRPWKKMERLCVVVENVGGVSGTTLAFRVGPFRRDLAKLKGISDEDLCLAAEKLDKQIQDMI
jgi:DNA-binding MarR family transcriptional regulator